MFLGLMKVCIECGMMGSKLAIVHNVVRCSCRCEDLQVRCGSTAVV